MTTTPTLTIAAFLEARLAEDEAVARAAVIADPVPWHADRGYVVAAEHECRFRECPGYDMGDHRAYGGLWDNEGALDMSEQTASHIARHDPARVLRQVEAMRAVVAEFERVRETGVDYELGYGLSFTLQTLASIWADHADYDERWAL